MYYADDLLNFVPILEFESPALGLSWIPVQDLELFSNWRPKVLWWFGVRARDFVCKKSEIHVMIQLHFLTNFWTPPKSPRQDFKNRYFIPNIFGYEENNIIWCMNYLVLSLIWLLDRYITSRMCYPKENRFKLMLFSFGKHTWLVSSYIPIY